MSGISFCDTKVVAKCGGSSCVYLNKIWGILPGDLVDINIAKKDDPTHYAVSTKKVGRDKSSYIVYLDKSWGFEQGDDVILTVTPRTKLDRGVGD